MTGQHKALGGFHKGDKVPLMPKGEADLLNWLIIIAIILILMALKLAKFIGVAVILALLVMLIVKNQIKRPKNRD